MNSKKAKILRRLAKEASIKSNSDKNDISYIEMENRRKIDKVYKLDENNKLYESTDVVAHGQLILSPASKKGIYKQFKNAMNGK